MGSTITKVPQIRGTADRFISIGAGASGVESTAGEFRALIGIGVSDSPTFAAVNAATFANGTTGQTTIGNTTGGVISPGQIKITNGPTIIGSGGWAVVQAASNGVYFLTALGAMTFGVSSTTGYQNLCVSNGLCVGAFTSSIASMNSAPHVYNVSGSLAVRDRANTTDVSITAAAATFSGPSRSGVYTFATVPTASLFAGYTITISDRAYKTAYSDGTNWLFVGTDTIIS